MTEAHTCRFLWTRFFDLSGAIRGNVQQPIVPLRLCSKPMQSQLCVSTVGLSENAPRLRRVSLSAEFAVGLYLLGAILPSEVFAVKIRYEGRFRSKRGCLSTLLAGNGRASPRDAGLRPRTSRLDYAARSEVLVGIVFARLWPVTRVGAYKVWSRATAFSPCFIGSARGFHKSSQASTKRNHGSEAILTTRCRARAGLVFYLIPSGRHVEVAA